MRRGPPHPMPASCPIAPVVPLESRSAGALGLVSAVCVHRVGNPSGSWAEVDVSIIVVVARGVHPYASGDGSETPSGRSGSQADRPGDTPGVR